MGKKNKKKDRNDQKKKKYNDQKKKKYNDQKKKERNDRKAARKQREILKWKQSDVDALTEQLKKYSLCLFNVLPDGNCFFRSIADQLEGNPNKHRVYRDKITSFMQNNSDDYRYFIVTDNGETWESYLSEMQKDGIWAGNVELKATSDCFECHIVIHQTNSPKWIIRNVNAAANGRYLHLAYSGSCHYDSVRHLDDKEKGSTPCHMDENGKIISEKSKQGNSMTEKEAICMRSSRCPSIDHVRHTLWTHYDDLDSALEALIHERNAFGSWENALSSNSMSLKSLSVNNSKTKSSRKMKKKKIPRNKPCPCNSGLKYKNCCKNNAKAKQCEGDSVGSKPSIII
eukprot:g1503.t1